jgi:hypothetical protein
VSPLAGYLAQPDMRELIQAAWLRIRRPGGRGAFLIDQTVTVAFAG